MEISLFTKCLFEFIGTLVLVLLGDGVVASTVLKRSKGFDGGWIVITIAWGLAVMCGVLIAGPYSGAHLNPAVSVGLAVAGAFPWRTRRPSSAKVRATVPATGKLKAAEDSSSIAPT